MDYVLVLDDDEGVRNVLRAVLRSEGFDVHTATSGFYALHLIETLGPPSVVVLDLKMPEMDGQTFHHKALLAGYRGPFLILSSNGARAAQAVLHAEAAFEKPFEPEEIVEKIRELVSSGQ